MLFFSSKLQALPNYWVFFFSFTFIFKDNSSSVTLNLQKTFLNYLTLVAGTPMLHEKLYKIGI